MKRSTVKWTLIAAVVCCAADASALEGDGTESSPYLIYNAADLKSIPEETSAYYRLTNDISGVTSAIHVFRGHFDGAGHSITVNYQKPEDGTWMGVFASCDGATISNLVVKGVITSGYDGYYAEDSYKLSNVFGTTYYHYHLARLRLGGVCYYATSSNFINVHNEAIISGSIINQRPDVDSYYYMGSDCSIGGIAGTANSCHFEQCSNSGKINGSFGYCSYYDYTTQAGLTPIANGIGGLVGKSLNSTFKDCYSAADVSATGYLCYAAGLIGITDAVTMDNCYFEGDCTGSAFIDRSSSTNLNSCVAKTSTQCGTYGITFNSSYHSSLSGDGSLPNGLMPVDPVMLSMQQWYAANLPSWDFDNIWYFPGAADSMPQHRITPMLSWDGDLIYGGSITFKSSNPYTNLSVESTEAAGTIAVDGNTVTFLKAGSIPLVINQPAVSPYKPVSERISVNVSKAPLYIAASDIEMEYGDEPETDDVLVYDGFINGDDETALAVAPVVMFGGTKTSDVGTYNIIVSGARADNYEIAFKSGIQTITPRRLVATPMDVSRRYGSTNPNFKIIYDGFVNGHNESMIAEYPVVTTQADQYSDAGEYSLVCRGGKVHSNYKLVSGVGTLTVSKAPLTIKVSDAIRKEGEPNPEFTLTFDGFRNNDDKYSLDVLPNIICDATILSVPGVYPITLEGGEDHNYEYKLKNGTLIIEEAAGISSVTLDQSDPDVKYYDLNGVEIQAGNIIPGIYIQIKQGLSSKVLIK